MSPEWRWINFLLLQLGALMMPNGGKRGERERRGGDGERRIFMMKTGEMKWNGGSQMSQNRENAAKLGKFFVALFQKTRANGREGGRGGGGGGTRARHERA